MADMLLDPRTFGLLNIGLSMMQNSGPSKTPQSFGSLLGGAGQQGLQAYQQANEMQQRDRQRQLQEQMLQMQMQGTRDKQAAIAQLVAQNPQLGPLFQVAPDEAIKRAFPEQEKPAYHRVGSSLVRTGPNAAPTPVFQEDRQPQLVEVPVDGQPGVTVKQWVTPGAATGTQVGGQKMPEILNPAVQAARRDIAKAGATNVTVPVTTERKYGEQFAGNVAKQDVDLLDSARKAPELAERSNRIRQILADGKAITGIGADFRLQFGKAAALAGMGAAQDAVVNTETLATDLAKNTLDSIKASGLGAGSGFSNADRDFLEKAVGGKISLEKDSLSRLAELAHRAAQKTTDRWNTRAKEIPQSALEGTGIRTDPITVPPLTGKPSAPSPGDVVGGYRFIGGDPGQRMNWKKVQ